MIKKFKLIILALFLAFSITSCVEPGYQNPNSPNNNSQENNNTLEIVSIEMNKRYGDATIIKYNDYDILVDGGEVGDDPYIKKALTKYVTDGVLDLLIITHPHSDHVGGITNLSTFSAINEITTVIDTGYNYGLRQSFKTNVLDYYLTKGTNYMKISDVMDNPDYSTIKIAEDVNLTFLDSEYYDKADTTSNINNTSIAFYLQYKNTYLCMFGDAERAAEASIMALNPKFTKKENTVIFKASHHGSKGANTDDFLNYLEPDYCFVSAAMTIEDGDSPYLGQHPYYEAMLRISKHTKKVYWNGINGTISIKTDGLDSINIEGSIRNKKYSYYDKTNQSTTLVDSILEQNITYFNSKWYQVGIENIGWADLRDKNIA